MLSGLLPSAGAKLYIACLSLSSTKSGAVSLLSVTPAGISASSSLQSSSAHTELVCSLAHWNCYFLHYPGTNSDSILVIQFSSRVIPCSWYKELVLINQAAACTTFLGLIFNERAEPLYCNRRFN